MSSTVEHLAAAPRSTPMALPAATAARLDVAIWLLTAAAAALVVLAIPVGAFRLSWDSFAGPAVALAVLIPAAWFYGRVRNEPKLASALVGTAQIVAFASIGAPLSYVATAASWAIPLQDQVLDAADKALGLDWRAVLTWMNAHGELHPIFKHAYGSLTLQASIAILALAFTGRLIWLRRSSGADHRRPTQRLLPAAAVHWRRGHHHLPEPARRVRGDSRRGLLAAPMAAMARSGSQRHRARIDSGRWRALLRRHIRGAGGGRRRRRIGPCVGVAVSQRSRMAGAVALGGTAYKVAP